MLSGIQRRGELSRKTVEEVTQPCRLVTCLQLVGNNILCQKNLCKDKVLWKDGVFRVLANGLIRMIGTQIACDDEEVVGDENNKVCGLWDGKRCHGSGLGFYPVGE